MLAKFYITGEGISLKEHVALIREEIEQKNLENLMAAGIDLGTTNSTVTVSQWCEEMKDIVSECLSIEQKTLEGSYNSKMVPSILALYKDRVFIGEGAKRLRSKSFELKLEKDRNIFYECKSELGVEKIYHEAPTELNSPAKISAELVKFLKEKSKEQYDGLFEHVTITIPASFTVLQRKDTYFAAERFGTEIENFDLLDEPIAAFIDYLMTYREKVNLEKNRFYNLLVFDFGGGTCDIAIISLKYSEKQLEITPKGVSRYYRLGGSDIDRAILYNLLLPKFFSENNLHEFDIDYDVKSIQIEPQLINVAEVLKTNVCNEVMKKEKFRRMDENQKESIIAEYPQKMKVLINSQEYFFTNPCLTLREFEKILEPFLDKDILYPIERDYTYSCSIFSPIEDILSRTGINQNDIDLCLMVGGSSLIPQVKRELSNYFKRATFLSYTDFESIKQCVSRGAAYHAFFRTITGKELVQTVAYDTIYLGAEPESIKIVEKGEKLSYDGENKIITNLRVPEKERSGEKNLLLEILVGDEKNPVMRAVWTMPPGTRSGDRLLFEYKFDQNQVLYYKLSLLDNPQVYLPGQVEYPLTHVVIPHSRYKKRLELEKEIERRRGGLDDNGLIDASIQLAQLYLEEGMREKALNICKKTVIYCSRDNKKYILCLMARIAREMQDFAKEEKFYLEAMKEDQMYSIPLFSLAYSQYIRGELCKAQKNIKLAIERDSLTGPYYVLQALLMNSLGNGKIKEASLSKAFQRFRSVDLLSDWELSWYIAGAELSGNRKRLEEAEEEKRKRSKQKDCVKERKMGFLPELIGGSERWRG